MRFQVTSISEDRSGNIMFEASRSNSERFLGGVARDALLDMGGCLQSDRCSSLELFGRLSQEIAALAEAKLRRGDVDIDGRAIVRRSDRRHPTFR